MPKQNSEKSGLQYAGLATQWLVSLGLGVFLGLKVDHWLRFRYPIATCVLPLLILVASFVKLIRDTGRGK